MIETVFLSLRTYRFLLGIAAVLGLFWCGFVAAGLRDPKAIGPYAFASIGILSGGSALLLRQRLSSPWAATVPGYRDSHIAAASVFCTCGTGIAATSAAILGIPPAFALILWFFSVTCFFVAFFSVTIWRIAAAPSLYGIFVGLSPLLIPKLELELHDYVLATLLLTNIAFTTLVIAKVRLAARDLHSNSLDVRSLRHAAYEKIARRVTAPSFEQGLIPPMGKHWVGTLILLSVLLAYRFLFGDSVWMLFFAFILPLFFTAPTAKQNLQRFFMLPLDRKQLLARGTKVLVLAQMRVWAICAVAGLIANIGLPVLQNLLLSLLLQIPVFAVTTLWLTIRNPKRVMLFMMALAVSIGLLQGRLHNIQLSLVVGVIVGVSLMPIAYYRWLNMEFD